MAQIDVEKYEALRKRLLLWTAMTDTERGLAGEPRTVIEWCQRYGASDRWVSKQRAKDEFKSELARLQQKKFDQNPNKPVPGLSRSDEQKELSNVELFGEVVRNQLMLAAQGDKTALDFIKSANVSKPFVDQLMAEFQTEFPDMNDTELAARFIESFEELCVEALRERGWNVARD
jgi:hypothetical protein